jgi:hypothetical protein
MNRSRRSATKPDPSSSSRSPVTDNDEKLGNSDLIAALGDEDKETKDGDVFFAKDVMGTDHDTDDDGSDPLLGTDKDLGGDPGTDDDGDLKPTDFKATDLKGADDSDEGDGTGDEGGKGKEAKGSGGGSSGDEGDGVSVLDGGGGGGNLRIDAGDVTVKEGDEDAAKEGDDVGDTVLVAPVTVGDGLGADGDVAPPPTLKPVPPRVEPRPVTYKPDLSKLDDNAVQSWIDQTGKSPDQHAAAIQSRLAQVHTVATGAVAAVHTEKDAQLALVDGFMTGAEQTVTTAISTGESRVKGAFDGVTTAVVSAAEGGVTKVDGLEKKGKDANQKVVEARKGEIKGVFDTTKTDVDGIRKQGATDYTGILKTEAKKHGDWGKTESARAKKAGVDKAAGLDEKKEGLESLTIECRKEVMTEIAAGAANHVDTEVAKATGGLDQKAASIADTAITQTTAPLSTDLDAKKRTAEGNIDAGKTTADGKVTAAADTARGALQASRDGAAKRVEGENERAQERLAEAAKVLRENTTNAALELKSEIEAKATTDANSYADVASMLQDSLAAATGPVREEDVSGTIDGAREQITGAHERHLEELGALGENGLIELDGTADRLLGEFDKAVDGQEGEADTLRQTMLGEITKTLTDLELSLPGLSAAFDRTLAGEVGPVNEAAGKLRSGATAAIETYKTNVQEHFTTLQTQLTEAVNGILGKMDSEVEPKAIEKANAKKIAILMKDVPALFDAMEGFGTDEAAIFSTLRGKTWGEIEALEALWDKHKSRTLRWYFRDDMSGTDLDIALSYLDHDRAKALKLELDQSRGYFNDDEARIEAVMKAATDDDLKELHKTYPATMYLTRSCLSGADLDNFNALADVNVAKEERHAKADAIRLHDAMEGMGTDEAKVKSLLEGAKTPEDRERLRKYFDEYAKTQGSYSDLDAALEYEFTGLLGGKESDYHLVKALAKTERDDAEVMAAKVFAAADGAGTDETAMFSALKNGDVAKITDQMKEIEKAKKKASPEEVKALDAQLAELQKKKDEHIKKVDEHMERMSGKKMSDYIDSEMDKGSLENTIAQDAFKNGRANPEDLIKYATDGLGTNEALFKEALTDEDGNPLPKEKVAEIDAALKSKYKTSLQDVADDELGGADYHEVSKLQLGKPETPDDLMKLVEMDKEYNESGWGGALVWVGEKMGSHHSGTEADHAYDRFKETFEGLESQGLNDDKFEEIKKKNPEIEQELQERFANAKTSFESYGKACDGAVDSLVTVLEIVGAVIATIATAGAASPALAMLIANIAIGTAGIIIKKVGKGDRYGMDQVALDFTKMVSTAVLGAALSKVKVFGEIAEAAGKKSTELFNLAGNKLGMTFQGKMWELGPTAQKYLEKFVSSGTEEVLTGTVTGTYDGLWNEQRYDQGVEQWLGGAVMDGVSSAPQNFVSGGAKGAYGEWAKGQKADKFKADQKAMGVDVSDADIKAMGGNLTYGSMGDDLLFNALEKGGSSVVGHLTTFSNYEDAGKFWEGLATGTPTAMLKGAISAYGTRAALPKNLARDLENGSLDPGVFEKMAGVLTEEEKMEIGNNLPPARQPPSVKALVQQKTEMSLKTVSTNHHDGSIQADWDPDLIQSATPTQVGIALQGGLTWDQVKDRKFSPEERLLIAQYAGSTGKLPPDFLNEECLQALQKMPADKRIAVLMDYGWDKAPKVLQQAATGGVDEGNTVSETLDFFFDRPQAVGATLTRYKGQALPAELEGKITAKIQTMSSDEQIALAKSLDLAELSKLPAGVRDQLTNTIVTAVNGGKVEPDLLVVVLAERRLDLKTVDLTKVPPASREGVVKAALAAPSYGAFQPDAQAQLLQLYELTPVDKRLPILAGLTSVPAEYKALIARDLRQYDVALAFGGVDRLKKEDREKLQNLVGGP